ncbi:hypothetical protein DDB_G0287313 [Dictyostelium discoideum AX4]|uniref:Uncharacterized protein n=1 Tax=Dictyostelium discoideum TaxID=44689 RepID=Q54KJ5_DICDI|nr:hypothetical protein DDB_G0287313 [Dictyostelium discoideum AX4]EAL63724.1 hypothetical protein DDB_G0287313 [Dictyostelium discoideum AX4]|eukprot:XP_637228.1 hypothetical protein DDB_G0287313 [Dictyostelium discoideum AX4]
MVSDNNKILNQLPIVIIKKIFRELEHEKPKLSAKTWCTHMLMHGIHHCNSTSVNVVMLSLVCKDWAYQIIPRIELPWFISNEKEYTFFKRWNEFGILSNGITKYPKILFDLDRVELNFPDDSFKYPTIPILENIKLISNFTIDELNRIQENNNNNNNNIDNNIKSLKSLKIELNNDITQSELNKPKNQQIKTLLKNNQQLETIEFKGIRDFNIKIDFNLLINDFLMNCNDENRITTIKSLSISNCTLINYSINNNNNNDDINNNNNNNNQLLLLKSLTTLKLIGVEFKEDGKSSLRLLISELENLEYLKLINNDITFIDSIIEKLYFNNKLKCLTIKEPKVIQNNINCLTIQTLIQYNTQLEKISLQLKKLGQSYLESPSIINSNINYKIYTETLDLQINGSEKLKVLKINSNFNVIINHCPSLERLSIIQHRDSTLPFLLNNISLPTSPFKSLPNLNSLTFIGAIFNYSTKEFFNELFNNNNNNNNNNNKLKEIGIIDIINQENCLNNLLISSFNNNNNLQYLKVKVSKNIYIKDLLNLLENLVLENSPHLKSVEIIISSDSIYSKQINKCSNLIFLELLSVLCCSSNSMIKKNNKNSNLKSIILVNNNYVKRCLCNSRNGANENCTSFIDSTNLITSLNSSINIFLPQCLKPLFKPYITSINHLNNICFDRW